MLRKTFILVAALAAMPSPPDTGGAQDAAESPSAFAYVSAAAEAVADVKGFCARNPGVCTTANSFAVTMEGKAKYSAKLIYEWANEATDEDTAQLPPELRGLAGFDTIETASTPSLRLATDDPPLTIEDLILERRAPDRS